MPFDEEKDPVVNACAEPDEARRKLRDCIASDLRGLLAFAQRNGFVVTVDLQALEPLAMRNYRMIGNVRAAR